MSGGPALPLLAAAAGDGTDFGTLLVALVAVLLATRLFGELAQRIGQPSVLGELVAGVVLGGSVLGVLDPSNAVIQALSEIGVLVLLFEIGMHTDLKALGKVGSTAITVGSAGVLLPFAGGIFVARMLGVEQIPALVVGAALTATSIGISARVLSDLGHMQTAEGRVVLGAAVYDDVIGLVILSVVSGIVGGGAVTALGVSRIAAIAIGFVIAAVVIGLLTVPRLFRIIAHVDTPGTIGMVALAFAFTVAWLADLAGSALIVGAFAAGLVLHGVPQRPAIERSMASLGHFFVPFFFASIGAAVDLRALASPHALLVGGALVVVGVVGKFLAGFAPWWFKGNRTLIGVAMIPRGEVGLIFAQMGLASGAIGADLFGALMLMVLVTTFVTPPLLGLVGRRGGAAPAGAPAVAGAHLADGGIDDLVAGVRADDEPRQTAR